MPRKRVETPRTPCSGSVGKKRSCWARPGSDWCSNHDPEQAERRRLAGKTRHKRFARAVLLDGMKFDRAKAPTIPHVLDRVLEVTDAVKGGTLDHRIGAVVLAGLRLVRDTLYDERERDDRLKFAWEQQRDAREQKASEPEGSSPEDASSGDVPPWMQLKPTN